MPSRSSPNLSSAEITLLRDHFGDLPGGDELMNHLDIDLIAGRAPVDNTNYPRPYCNNGDVYVLDGLELAVQGAAKSLFTGTLSYDLNADAFTGAGALNTATLSQITTLAKQQGACAFCTL